jgi:phosphoribulokinase
MSQAFSDCPSDSDRRDNLRLLVPTVDTSDPEMTILILAFDEELTVGRFIDWCGEDISGAGTCVEILIAGI